MRNSQKRIARFTKCVSSHIGRFFGRIRHFLHELEELVAGLRSLAVLGQNPRKIVPQTLVDYRRRCGAGPIQGTEISHEPKETTIFVAYRERKTAHLSLGSINRPEKSGGGRIVEWVCQVRSRPPGQNPKHLPPCFYIIDADYKVSERFWNFWNLDE